jgi:hypothetical protein
MTPPQVRVFAAQAVGDRQPFPPTRPTTYNAYEAAFNGGVYVGGGQHLTGPTAPPGCDFRGPLS